MTSCPVCCETFTKTVRKAVTCAACHYAACTGCYRRYLTEKLDAGCMRCTHPFDRVFLNTTFSKAWIKGEYTRHRENILLDIELARMPTSQHLVANYRVAQTLRETMRAEADERARLRARLREIDINKWNQLARLRRIENSRYASDGIVADAGADRAAASTNYARACPAEGCRGFLSQTMQCGVCESYACRDCMSAIGPARDVRHACDPAAVQTARYIRSETRACPKCRIAISKVDGCDQMFCVYCQTAFSWRTGDVVTTGRIHNPEYFRWLRDHSATGEIDRHAGGAGPACGGGPDPIVEVRYVLVARAVSARTTVREHDDAVMNAFSRLRHIQFVEINRLDDPAVPADHSFLRIRYLLGSITRDDMKKELARLERRREKHTSLRLCYETLIAVSNDYFLEFVRPDSATSVMDLLDSLREICAFATASLAAACKMFDCACAMPPAIPPRTHLELFSSA